MRDTHSYSVSGSTPSFVSSPVCFSNLLFFTWFEFIGMNHYDGERLWDVEKVRSDEERSDKLTMQSQAAKTPHAHTSVQYSPPS